MILASRRPDGTVKYFSALTGIEYKPGRETGTFKRFIPDYAFGFLSPKIAPSTSSGTGSGRGALKNAAKPEREAVEGWISKLIAWFKSFFSNGRK